MCKVEVGKMVLAEASAILFARRVLNVSVRRVTYWFTAL